MAVAGNSNTAVKVDGMIHGADRFCVGNSQKFPLPASSDCCKCERILRDAVILRCGHHLCRRCAVPVFDIVVKCPMADCNLAPTFFQDIDPAEELNKLLKDLNMSPELSLPLKRVLVFGSTKAGKTSMLNAITGQQHETNDSALGCTLQTEQLPVVVFDNVAYLFYDTVGLNEGQGGTVSADNAADRLLSFARKARYGFNLLIFVFQQGAGITEAMKQNYNIFAEVLTSGNVPILAVVTHCEFEKELNDWVDRHKAMFDERQMTFESMVGTCFKQAVSNASSDDAEAKFYDYLRAKSTSSVLEAIKQFSLPEPFQIFGEDATRFEDVLNDLSGLFMKFLNLPADLFIASIRIGLSELLRLVKGSDIDKE